MRNQTHVVFRISVDIITALSMPMLNLASHGIPPDVLTGDLVLTSRRLSMQIYQQTIRFHA